MGKHGFSFRRSRLIMPKRKRRLKAYRYSKGNTLLLIYQVLHTWYKIRTHRPISVQLSHQTSNISTGSVNHCVRSLIAHCRKHISLSAHSNKDRKAWTSRDWSISWFVVKQGCLFTLLGVSCVCVTCCAKAGTNRGIIYSRSVVCRGERQEESRGTAAAVYVLINAYASLGGSI